VSKSTVVTAEVVEREATDLVFTKVQPGLAIEANFAAVQAYINRLVADYAGLVITEGYVPQAKKDRAYLNSLKTSLTQRFRDVKREFMAPVETLDRQIKELQAPIEAASAAIDAQVKAFEERERADKRAELVKHYTEYAGAYTVVVPFERIEEAAWPNKTTSLMAAFSTIESIVERIARDDATLDGLGLSHITEAKTEYFATLDVSAAIARSKALDAAEERTRVLDAEKAANAVWLAEQAAKAEKPITYDESRAILDAIDEEKAAAAELVADPVSTFTFSVVCTDAQRAAIIGNLRAMGLTGTVRKAVAS